MKRYTLLLAGLLLLGTATAQPARTRPALTLADLARQDLSTLWVGPLPEIDREDTTTLAWFERPEPLGYIGADYRRFRIHIRSIHRSGTDPLTYRLSGLTRTGGTICRFEGELHIDSLLRRSPSDAPDAWGGIHSGWMLKGHYTLREDPRQPGAGIFEGIHTLDIAADSAGTIYYDTLMLVADGYRNNQWRGTWRSYRTGAVRTCNWGDYRIPDSGPLDIGTGEFIPGERYAGNGWQSYLNTDAEDDEVRAEARSEESGRWWLFAE